MLNSFSALYVAHSYGSIKELMDEVEADRRMKALGPIIGDEFVVSCSTYAEAIAERSRLASST